ncbi:MAG: hypothetical protein HWE24_21355 [Oceanospirillaceae bacterium]|nr:hypothetical protein [Oceanospirillaceae bacterium]
MTERAENQKLAKENERLTGLVKQLWLELGCIHGYQEIFQYLRSLNESCGINRVHYLVRRAGLKPQVGYLKPRARTEEAHTIVNNVLERQFQILEREISRNVV